MPCSHSGERSALPPPAPPAPCDSLSATKKQNWVLQDVGPEKGPPAQAPGREPCPRLSSSALGLGHDKVMRSDLFRVVTGHKPGNRICDVCGCTSGATWDSRMTPGFRWKPSPQPSNYYADPTVTAFERGSRWRPHLRNPWPPGLSPGVLGSGTRPGRSGQGEPRGLGAHAGGTAPGPPITKDQAHKQ